MSTYRQRQLARIRDSVQTRREDEAAARQQRRRVMATTRKTAQGDRVTKWPSAEPVFSLIEEVDKAMRELFTEAQDRRDSDAAIDTQSQAAISDRFPSMGGK